MMKSGVLLLFLLSITYVMGQTPDSTQVPFYEEIKKNENFKSNNLTREMVAREKIEEILKKESLVISDSEKGLVESLMVSTYEDDTKNHIKGPSQYDSRLEIRDLNPVNSDWEKQILYNARSVGLIIERSMIHQVTDTLWQIDISSKLGTLYNLCPEEPFRDQPVAGHGTGFVVTTQSMMTAAHVFFGSAKEYVVVFGFEMFNKVGAYEAFIPAKDIYSIEKVIYRSEDLDVLVFNVDRPFESLPVKWSTSLSTPSKASVYMIGHPMGLPKKVALNAEIAGNNNPSYFYTSLDAFQGNSGSPVFRMDTHELIGVLVAGGTDYQWTGTCNRSTLYTLPFYEGEKVIRIEQIMEALKDEEGN